MTNSEINLLRKVRVGIDVGGTFTHAVAIDSDTLALVGKVKVPTTHKSAEGVARGIIDSLFLLLKEFSIDSQEVSFIAHSTTQATNALLEGDVAVVGVLGMGRGFDSLLAKLSTSPGKIELAPGKFLNYHHKFVDTSKPPSEETLRRIFNELRELGAGAIAISEAFSVDDDGMEMKALEIAQEMGFPATAGSLVSRLYGLKVRTMTAILNAAMLPKMIESADMTEKAVREAGIKAPVMIMRSDGGVMDIASMRKRPILTMLSGPAAGVAAAMMYLRISDGIFLEVGGTSTDISAICNGRAQIKSGEIGGKKLYLSTLDVRTVGVAGGSMPRLENSKLIDVGPRSAHIAGLGYASFSQPVEDPEIKFLQPLAGDPSNYFAIGGKGSGGQYCLTPTCASNFLGLVSDTDCAKSNSESIKDSFDLLAKTTHQDSQKLAENILQLASDKCMPIVNQLLKEYKLDPETTMLIGGGGGAAAIVPYLAKRMNMRYSLAENADVVSAIGVGMSLLRETIERQIVNPTQEDIVRVRQEAFESVRLMGADVDTIEIHVEVDSRSNIVRATASGATAFAKEGASAMRSGQVDKAVVAAESMRVEAKDVSLLVENSFYQVYGAYKKASGFMGIIKGNKHCLRVLDKDGVVRLQIKNGEARLCKVRDAQSVVCDLAERHAQYGDAGRIIPNFVAFVGSKMVDLSGLLNLEQVLALFNIELESSTQDTDVIVTAALA